MKELNLFRLNMKSESPLLVGFTGPSHNIYDTLKYIPSITLNGALGTAILEHFCEKKNEDFGKCRPCNLKDTCEFYKFFYQNILSITNGSFRNNLNEKHFCQNPDIIPSHPLLLECKVCSKDEKKEKKEIRIYNKLLDWLDSIYIKSLCPEPKCKRKTTLEPIKKNYCRNDNCKLLLRNPEIGFTTSPSINYAKKSSLKGYLYQYNYIQSESIFEGYLLFEKNNKILDFFKKLKNIRIGRGKSRGFGKVSLKLEDLNLKEKIERNKKIIKEMIGKETLILSAKTHIFSLETGLETNSIEKGLGLISNHLIDINQALHRANDKLNLNISIKNDMFSLKNTLGSLEMISGWSYKSQQPKPHIKAAIPGSLYKFNLNNNIDDKMIEALAYLEFIGLNKYSRIGYNLIYYPSMKEVPKYA